MGKQFAHGFDAQPVQRCETLCLILLSNTERFIVGFSLHIRQDSMQLLSLDII